MATTKQVLARTTGAGSAATRYRKSARTSARAFISAMTQGSSRARRALGLRSTKSRQAKNLARRKTLGGMGG